MSSASVNKAEKQHRPADIHSLIYPAHDSSLFTIILLLDYGLKENFSMLRV